MGIPAIQLFLIFARQMAKPVSNSIMIYGKKHPFFRNRILIPAGKGIRNITTRLRMRDLGLGKPANLVQISDEAALEQASDILQETVLYIYGIGIFTFYYYYTKKHEKETVSAEDLQELATKFDESIERLQNEIDDLRKKTEMATVGVPKKHNEVEKSGGSWFSWFGSTNSSDQRKPPTSSTADCQNPTISRREALERLSSSTVNLQLDNKKQKQPKAQFDYATHS